MTLPESIRHGDFLQGMPESLATELDRLAQPRHIAAGEVIFAEGARQDLVFLIASGHVRLDMIVPQRGRTPILTLGPGDLMAFSSFVGDHVMTATAIALEPVEAVVIPGDQLRQLCESNQEIGYHLMRHVAGALARRLIATRLQLLDLFRQEPGPPVRPWPTSASPDDEG